MGLTTMLVYADARWYYFDRKWLEEEQVLSQCLAKKFEIKTLGRLKYFLRIEVTLKEKYFHV
jgi:hypothetical protein